MERKLKKNSAINFQSYVPKLSIPKKYLDLIDSIEVTPDGQIAGEMPWLEELKRSVKENPSNQLLLDAIQDFSSSLNSS